MSIGRRWVHCTGRVHLIGDGVGHAERRELEYACFWAGWCRVANSDTIVYIEGASLLDVHAVVEHIGGLRGDRRILADVTPDATKTKKYEYDRRNGVWVRERSRGREPEVIGLTKTGLGPTGWDYPPNTGP